MKKKVIIFSEKYFPESMAIAIRTEFLVRQLRARQQKENGGIEFELITCTREAKDDYPIHHTFFRATGNRQGIVSRLFMECLIGFEVFFRLLFSRYDAVLLTSPPFFTNLIIAFGAALTRKPYVLDIRDYYPEILFDAQYVRKESLLGRFLLWLERTWYRKAMFVATVTDSLVEEITTKIGKANTPVVLLRNGYDKEKFKISKEKYKRFTLIFHSNFGQFHDIDLILKLAEKLKKHRKIEFLIIGDGVQAYKIKNSNLPNIRYIGQVDYHQIPELIARGNLGLSFRVKGRIGIKSIPVKVYEYIGAGLPVIRTPLGDCGEMLEHFQIGFQFSPDDIDAIADKIVEISKNETMQKQMQKRLEKRRLDFSRSRSVQAFIDQLNKSL